MGAGSSSSTLRVFESSSLSSPAKEVQQKAETGEVSRGVYMSQCGSSGNVGRSSLVRTKRSPVAEMRYQAEQTANRAAEKRFAEQLSSHNYPNITQQPLKRRDAILASISVKQPFLTQVTTNALTIKWIPEQSGGAARIKRYNLQWKIDTKNVEDSRSVNGYMDVTKYEATHATNDKTAARSVDSDTISRRVYFTSDRNWHSLPEGVVNRLKLEATVCGLGPECPPVIFRVRGRCNAGWGPWSNSSLSFSTLSNHIPAPAAGGITANSVELRWKALKDQRYGNLKVYILMGRTENVEDDWHECYTGMQPKLLVTRVGTSGLTPNTVYLFKVITVAVHGPEPNRDNSELVSNILRVQTLGAVPDAPRPPRVLQLTHESISLFWIPPCSNGSRITGFSVLGKTGQSQAYAEWYAGDHTRCLVGTGTSFASSVTPVRIFPLTEYNIKLAASNSYGTSLYSTPLMVVTSQPPSASLVEFRAPQTPDGDMVGGVLETAIEHPPMQTAHTMPTGVHSSESQESKLIVIEGGWYKCWDATECAFYYFHPHSGCTQWDHPAQIQHAGSDLVFRRKRFKFLYLLHQHSRPATTDATVEQPAGVLPLSVDRKRIVFTSFSQLRSEVSHSTKLILKPKVTFVGEAGIDSGGVSKDWFICLSRAFADPQFCLFRRCDDAGGQIYTIDHRSNINSDHLEYFRFVGRVLGMVCWLKFSFLNCFLSHCPVFFCSYTYSISKWCTVQTGNISSALG